MRIEAVNGVGGRASYWTVLVHPNELPCGINGKLLPYSTWIGTLRQDREPRMAHVWSPAASKPRGYRAAALTRLEIAYAALVAAGWPEALEVSAERVQA